MRLPRTIVLRRQPVADPSVLMRNGEPLPRLKYPGGARHPFSCGAGCLGCSSILVLLPLTYAIVGLVAPAVDSKDRQDVREFFEAIGARWLAFVADTTHAQVVSLIVVGALVAVLAIAFASLRGYRALDRLPCPQCGATPLDSSFADLLVCARCQVVWELEVIHPSSGDDHHHHVHHHH